MCGIVGIINLKRDLTNQNHILENMLQTLTHRGPDEFDIKQYTHALLGHKRLIVIDPEGGKQPMTKKIKQNEYTIVYNGELYNTEEIRQDLLSKGYKFLGYSDTEVLLTAYIEWGSKVVDYINGIYAFAIWNEIEQTLFLARDHLGVKPLFYSIKNEFLLFSSEIKALLKHPLIEPIVDEEGVLEIFSLGPARTPGSAIFKDIKEVPPGNYLIYSNNKINLIEYWKLEAKEHFDDKKTTILHTKQLLIDAISRQLVSDVPLGTFLSGGLDSSAISTIAASFLKKYGRGKLNTYSINYQDNELYFKKSLFQPNSDTEWVKRMSKFIDSNHKEIILDNIDLVKALDKAVYANDLPGMADIDSSLYLFCREVRKNETVAISGECADEIFGGYPWFIKDSYFYSNTFPWAQSLKIRKSLIKNKNLPLETYVQDKYNDTIKQVPKLKGETKEDIRMREIFFLNIKWFMMTLLNRKDRMSMANSLEVRVPFADYRIVEYAYNIPRHLKLLYGREKGLLREALKGILPIEIIKRKKSPYPKTHHPQYTKAVQDRMKHILNDYQSPILDLIDAKKVKELVENHGEFMHEPWYGQLMTGPQVIAYLIQINIWLKDYNIKINI